MSSIIAASCCCNKKYPPPPPQVGIWYYCKPRVCVEGFNRCFAPRVDEFITFLAPEVLALLSDNDWLDQYEWVSGGQYWELGPAIGPGTLSEIREQLGLDRVEPVAMRTREVPYVPPDNEFLVIPDHRVTGNSGPTAQPRATESLVLNQYDPDGDLYQITFHMVPSFIAHMHSTVPLFPQWAGRASIANALPPNVMAKNGQPTKEFALARYRRPQQGEGFGGILESISNLPYPEASLNYTISVPVPTDLGITFIDYALDIDSLVVPLPSGNYDPDESTWQVIPRNSFRLVFVAGERVRGMVHTDSFRNFMEGNNNECERYGPPAFVPEEADAYGGGFIPPDYPPSASGSPPPPLVVIDARTRRQIKVDPCKALEGTVQGSALAPACPTSIYSVIPLSGYTPTTPPYHIYFPDGPQYFAFYTRVIQWYIQSIG